MRFVASRLRSAKPDCVVEAVRVLIGTGFISQVSASEVVAQRATAKGRLKAFAVEPEVSISNNWSNRYTMIEVSGLDRPGLLYALTSTLSKLNLNIVSAHVATFGERVVDVFYVVDLHGAKITSATRQAAISVAWTVCRPWAFMR